MRSLTPPAGPVGTQALRLKPGVPVLVRGPGETQVGLARTLVLEGLSTGDQAFLASLEGRRIALSRAERDAHAPVVEALSRCGLLEPIAVSAPPRGVIRIRNLDPVTAWVAVGLALAGTPALSIVDPRSATDIRNLGIVGNGSIPSLLRMLKDARPTLRLAIPEEHARLEILRSHGAPDIVHSRCLTSRDIPHLEIVSDEEGITVGPLVVPGATACETCLGIERTEEDPWWPRIALQLGSSWRDAGLVVPTPVALQAAGLALREILAHLAGGAPTSTRWRVRFDEPLPEAVVCRPHPACGCGASVGSEPAASARPSMGAGDANRGSRRRAS